MWRSRLMNTKGEMRFSLTAIRTILIALALVTALGLGLVRPLITLAAEDTASNGNAAFSLQLEDVGSGILLTLRGDALDDLYAFEVRLRFDSHRLRLTHAELPERGFSIAPKVEGDMIRLAYTKTGAIAGIKGKAELASLSFDRLRAGDAVVEATELILVDSELNRLDWPFPSPVRLVVPETAGAISFADIAGHWASSYIAEAAGLGLVNGYNDGTFRPEKPVTRAEFVTLLARAAGFGKPDDAPLPFTDKENIPQWAIAGVAGALERGIVKGYDDGRFHGERSITRAEIAVMLSRALQLPVAREGTLDTFLDRSVIPDWSAGSVASAKAAGLMEGRSADRFAPLATATRAEAATLVLAVYRYIGTGM